MRPVSPTEIALSLLLFPAGLPAQLAINEVLVDPPGKNLGKTLVEILNPGTRAFTPKGWQICAPLTYAALPSLSIPAGGIVRLHLGASGTDTAKDFYFPLFRDLTAKDTFLIYKSALFTNSKDIVDFVSWGGGTGRILQAVSVGLWPSATATVPLPAEGQTIAWSGGGHTDLAWFRDATPTLGASNGVPKISRSGKGCATSRGVPSLDPSGHAVDGNLDFRLQASGALPGGLMILLAGTRPGGGIPILGCPLEVLPDLFVAPLLSGPKGGVDLPFPLHLPRVSLKGLILHFQAAPIDPGSPNKAFGMSPGLGIQIG